MNDSRNDSRLLLRDETLLDNPIWNALTTLHAELAMGARMARRYKSDVGPLAGLRVVSAEAFAELAEIVPVGDVAVLFLEAKPELPAGWEMVAEGKIIQMVCAATPEVPVVDAAIVSLGETDFGEMVALAKLTEPGPFRERTPTLGGFFGIRVGGRLAAMAGRRCAIAGRDGGGFVEVSAVCTHPDFRGHGYARALVATVARDVLGDGMVPYLTSYAHNAGAIRVYEQVGFVLRRGLELAVVKPPVVK